MRLRQQPRTSEICPEEPDAAAELAMKGGRLAGIANAQGTAIATSPADVLRVLVNS